MRTTLTLDDDVIEQVKRYARARSVSLGKAASELIRTGVSTPLRTRTVNGLHVVDLPPDSLSIALEDIKKFQDDGP